MEITELCTIIRGLQAFYERISNRTTHICFEQDPDFDYDEYYDEALYKLRLLLYSTLHTAHFFRIRGKVKDKDEEGDFVFLFDTAERLDDYLHKSTAKGNDGVTVEQISYEDFLDLANFGETELNNYICIESIFVVFALSPKMPKTIKL